jgi:hypothetical protein
MNKKTFSILSVFAIILLALPLALATRYTYVTSENQSSDIVKFNTTDYFYLNQSANTQFNALLELTPRLNITITVSEDIDASVLITDYTRWKNTRQQYVVNKTATSQVVAASNYTYNNLTGEFKFVAGSYWSGLPVTIIYNKTFTKNTFNLLDGNTNQCVVASDCQNLIANNGGSAYGTNYGIKLDPSRPAARDLNQTGWVATWTDTYRTASVFQCSAATTAILSILATIAGIGILYLIYKGFLENANFTPALIVGVIVSFIVMMIAVQFIIEQASTIC